VSLTLDHVILAVPDLTTASAELADALNVSVDPGGQHPGWGTHNAIARFGSSYLELIAVRDLEQARRRPRGARLLALLDRGPGWLGYALRATDLDAAVRDIRARGLPIGDPEPGRRTRPDGVELRWRTAAFDEALWGGLLPFLIQHERPPAAARSDLLAVEVGARDLARAASTYAQILGQAPEGATWHLPDGCALHLASATVDGLRCVAPRGNADRELTVLGARFRIQVGSA
jgi:hypothetical protein